MASSAAWAIPTLSTAIANAARSPSAAASMPPRSVGSAPSTRHRPGSIVTSTTGTGSTPNLPRDRRSAPCDRAAGSRVSRRESAPTTRSTSAPGASTTDQVSPSTSDGRADRPVGDADQQAVPRRRGLGQHQGADGQDDAAQERPGRRDPAQLLQHHGQLGGTTPRHRPATPARSRPGPTRRRPAVRPRRRRRLAAAGAQRVRTAPAAPRGHPRRSWSSLAGSRGGRGPARR